MHGAVVAGGGATRYGGVPKGLPEGGGRRILDRGVDAPRSATGRLPILVANAPAPAGGPPPTGTGPPLPRAGTRVVEAGFFPAGPMAARNLASLGAAVIKVEALDGEPVFVLFVILCSTVKGHLKMLSRVSHFVSQREVREFLRGVPNRTDLLERIRHAFPETA